MKIIYIYIIYYSMILTLSNYLYYKEISYFNNFNFNLLSKNNNVKKHK